jgi:hypothetical protein
MIAGRLHLLGKSVDSTPIRLVLVEPGPRIRQVPVGRNGRFELDSDARDDATVEVWVEDRLAGRCAVADFEQRLGRDRGVLAVMP